ncbi:uncharacterized protein LOC118647739 [Monomorium pharaonis]|uniref:uncharacterized protein LOC118647739 n=1 Tax=Monomorium pharaonis TaxID=307658 RepID=UPI0017474FF8|nr:uncharacterized protein LOC118647739 [Monomorium pharaonis]
MPLDSGSAGASSLANNAIAWRRRRGTIKASCTRIETFVNSVNEVTPEIAAQLEERRSRLEIIFNEYDDIQSKIESIEGGNEEVSDRANFEEAYYALCAQIRQLMRPASAQPVVQPRASRSPTQYSTEHAAHVRLPKINLPNFCGNYDEWFPFYDSFKTLIHNNESLSNIQKFQYLRSSLAGQAINVVNALEISERNYDLTWSLLKERYDNKRIIVQSHVKAMLELTAINKENANGLRQISDGVSRHIRALTALGRPADKWDDLLIYIISAKLDSVTSREWHASLKGTELPTLKQFLEFVAHRCQTLEVVSKRDVSVPGRAGARAQGGNGGRQAACVATVRGKCYYCMGEHTVYARKEFLKLPIDRRITEMRRRKICLNCLRTSTHAANKCASGGCRTCGLKHNTFLHSTREPGGDGTNPRGNESDGSSGTVNTASVSAHAAVERSGRDVLLSTAIIYVYDKNNTRRMCRVLLDSGSQVNFITGEFLGALRLAPRPTSISISGIGGASSMSNQIANVKLRSRVNSFTANIDCVVADRITDGIPATTIKRRAFKLPAGIKLADPQFNMSASVDMLIGTELFWRLLCVGQIAANSDHPTLQKTRLGWILAGRTIDDSSPTSEARVLHAAVSNAMLHTQLERFWQTEEIANGPCGHSMDERACESHFMENARINEQGRYIVKLPIKPDVFCRIGESRKIALKRFYNLEKRLESDSGFRESYARFLREYERLGHMRRVTAADHDEGTTVYLPHHGVMKSGKLRVVFDASCKTSTGYSLNDALMVGPMIQEDLITILTRFRSFAYAFAADVIKMYRQILLDGSQTRLQRILWRDNPKAPVDTYELLTVTYGTSSASFLATRCLKDLGEKYASEFPLGSRCVTRDFYVDDLLTGADTKREAERARKEVVKLLARGRFELSKWASNYSETLNDDGDEPRGRALGKEDGHKVLGIFWEPRDDKFRFQYEQGARGIRGTKRAILAETASLFDPLGLLGPIIIIAKIIMQDIWQSGLEWDESLPEERWKKFREQLPHVNQLRLPRWTGFSGGGAARVQIHGFCDASERAYGACVYIRRESTNRQPRIELLISKSRVAPVKAISIPRLELNAALLLARLIEKIRSAINLSRTKLFLWTDSTIALQWISSPSRKWATFVANRVGEIQSLTRVSSWRHVPSADNPADVLSRGICPSELANHSMWWNGPEFLKSSEQYWPSRTIDDSLQELPEQKRVVAVALVPEQSVTRNIIGRHSSLGRVLRVVAYCLRFARRVAYRGSFVSHNEMTTALRVLTRAVQRESFPEEYRAMEEGRAIATSSKLLSLTPFLDGNGIIRVGGRLKNSALSYDTRHPILLPKGHCLTKLVIKSEHARNLHAGLQATIHAVRQRFWPLAVRSTARKIIKNCITCFKCKPSVSQALMADLLKARVTVSRPFTHTGVDYAGPIFLKEGKRRNARSHKAYIAIFVCFATKAAHIEIVSDLTIEAFLGALKRFVSRRGSPTDIYSDNGTTFVGANRQISEFYDLIKDEQSQRTIKESLRSHEITWHFIPPHAPHFGGLWEAAVKSAKSHMRKVVGNAGLTLEEAQTLFCEIEAVMNSRPLTPLSTDPSDLKCITPGHFLIGSALNSFPTPNLTEEKENWLKRWQRVEQMRQHFWKRWSAEYLHTLIERQKWKTSKGERCKVGRIALIRQPGLGPMQWAPRKNRAAAHRRRRSYPIGHLEDDEGQHYSSDNQNSHAATGGQGTNTVAAMSKCPLWSARTFLKYYGNMTILGSNPDSTRTSLGRPQDVQDGLRGYFEDILILSLDVLRTS